MTKLTRRELFAGAAGVAVAPVVGVLAPTEASSEYLPAVGSLAFGDESVSVEFSLSLCGKCNHMWQGSKGERFLPCPSCGFSLDSLPGQSVRHYGRRWDYEGNVISDSATEPPMDPAVRDILIAEHEATMLDMPRRAAEFGKQMRAYPAIIHTGDAATSSHRKRETDPLMQSRR